ncbi:MAG: Uma2 family endonuclease [Isosphaeraceae bacterium]
MSTALAPTIAPDAVVSFDLAPGALARFLESRAEGGPLLKCVGGRATLVSPGRPHESMRHRLDALIRAVCLELAIDHEALGSTTMALPAGAAASGTAYEADEAYYIQSCGTDDPTHPPDLAVEVVVTHPETKALQAGAALGIPELWVLDVPGRRLTFYVLATRGKFKGSYRAGPRSRAFPFLTSAEVRELLWLPTVSDTAFLRACHDWARRVLPPRL